MTITDNTQTGTTAPENAAQLDTITIPYSQATLGGMYAVALHSSKDDVTPVICTVRVTDRTFIATDRYSIGEWTHTPEASDTADSTPASDLVLLIPRSAAEWLAKQSPKVLGFGPRDTILLESGLVVVFARDSITIQWETSGTVLAVTRFAEVGGNFPPVARLLSGAVAAEDAPSAISLKPAFVEKFTKGAAKTLEREAALTMRFTKTESPSKPGPVIFEFAQFRGLLQPNLMLR